MMVWGDPVYNAIVVMFFEIFGILILSMYLSQVLPQEYGTTRPWTYPFIQLSQYFLKRNTEVLNDLSLRDIPFDSMELMKEDQNVKDERFRIKSGNYDRSCPLVLNGMRKSYGSNLVLKDVTFAVEKGVVMGLLGPNGAGKTSLISILTGFLLLILGVYNPSAGQAIMGGYDSVIQPVAAFQSIGVCPQVIYTNFSLTHYGMI
jgi:ABC-type multidrug transport system fused ATPase/permease subunit